MEGFAVADARRRLLGGQRAQPALLSQAVAAAAEEHGTFIEISAHPILTHAVGDTLDPTSHHHSVGTLWRDGDDTLRFHTNLNTVHTSHPPQTPHPVEPHPVLPTTPWHHSQFWVNTRPITPIRSVAGVADSASVPDADGPIPAEWYLNLAWPARELTGKKGDADASWLVITDSGLGDEIGRALGDEFAADDRADGAAGRRRRPDGDHRRARRCDPCAVRTAGHRWPVRLRSRLRPVQRRAPAVRGDRRNGRGAKALPAHPQRPAGRRRRPGQRVAGGAVGPGSHAGAGAPGILGPRHRHRRVGARRLGRPLRGGRGPGRRRRRPGRLPGRCAPGPAAAEGLRPGGCCGRIVRGQQPIW